MKYSLGSLMVVVALAPPGLAFLWWLRHTWLVQVWMMLALMVAVLCTGCWLLSALIAATQRLGVVIVDFFSTRPESAKALKHPRQTDGRVFYRSGANN
jgi:hypothetical protein